MSELYDKDLLDKDVRIGNIKERCKEATYEYHNNLLQLMDMKVNGSRGEDNITQKFSEVVDGFSTVVALQNNIVRLSFEIAKDTLQRAFELSGLDEKELTNARE